MRIALTNLLVLGLLGAAVAAAQPAEGERARARALDLFEESAALYRDGRFAEAATLLRRAHELHPSPPLLYNLGRALEGAGEREGALEAYEGYLDAVEDAPGEAERRADAETRAEALRAPEVSVEPSTQTSPQPEPEPVVVEPTDRARPSLAPWIVLGAGGLVAVSGLLVGWRAVERNDVAADPSTSLERAVTLHDRARRLALGANVLFAVGGALAIAGLTWGLLTRDRDEPDRPVALDLTIGPGSLRLDGHF